MNGSMTLIQSLVLFQGLLYSTCKVTSFLPVELYLETPIVTPTTSGVSGLHNSVFPVKSSTQVPPGDTSRSWYPI